MIEQGLFSAACSGGHFPIEQDARRKVGATRTTQIGILTHTNPSHSHCHHTVRSIFLLAEPFRSKNECTLPIFARTAARNPLLRSIQAQTRVSHPPCVQKMPERSEKPIVFPAPLREVAPQSGVPERRAGVRYPFTAAAEIFELRSQARVSGRCSDLSPG